MTYSDYRSTPQVPLEILTRLEQAGLGNTPQQQITADEYNRAMAGEQVRALPGRHPGQGFKRRQSFQERRLQYLESNGRVDDIRREFEAPGARIYK